MSLFNYHLVVADTIANIAKLGRQSAGAEGPTGRANMAALETLVRHVRSLNPTTNGLVAVLYHCTGGAEPYTPGQRQAQLLANVGRIGGFDPDDTEAVLSQLVNAAVQDALTELRTKLQGEGMATDRAADLQQRLDTETTRAQTAEQTVAELRQEIVDLRAAVQRHAQAADVLALGATDDNAKPAPRRRTAAAA